MSRKTADHPIIQSSDHHRFILASASPRRLELLAQIGLTPAEIIAAEIDETPHKAELPAAYALRMAQEKALKVAATRPQTTILAADTVVACGRRILGKAEDERMARKFLQLLSGRRHRVYTAICLYSPAMLNSQPSKARRGAGGSEALGATPPSLKTKTVMTRVQFKRLHEAEITAYLASGEWQGKAGAYAIQGKAASFIPWINGSYSNVVGLPLAEVASMLATAGQSLIMR